MIIRKVKVEDLPRLFDFIRKTFADTYAIHNTKANIVQYLVDSLSNHQLQKEYNNTDSHFYIALDGANLLGYIKLNTKESQTEMVDLDALEIERIYIHTDYQKSGMGKDLINFCKDISREWNCSYLWLGVWEKNENAIGFYEHMGFQVFDTHVFVLGEDRQKDYLMKWKGE